MKAIIIKNNDFETIGFEVTGSGKTLFSWGISPLLKSNFQKEINVNDWITEIFELVRLEAILREQGNFVNDFFRIASGQHLLKDIDKGADFSEHKQLMSDTRNKIENIIKNII
jgi:hypothetical protein